MTEKPFEEISDETFAEAMKLVDSCEKVIDAGVTVGKTNSRIAELIEKAKNDKNLKKMTESRTELYGTSGPLTPSPWFVMGITIQYPIDRPMQIRPNIH